MKRKALLLTLILGLLILTLLFSTLVRTRLANAESATQWSKVLMKGEGQAVIQTSDGGYAVAGQSDEKTLLAKTNSAGEVEWSRTYGEVGKPYRALSVIQSTDGGYALGCMSRSGFNFLKTDAAGNMEWCKGFFYGSNDVIEFNSIIQTRNGGYFLAGGCVPGNSGFIVETDENGNMQWNRTFSERGDSYFLRCAAEAIDDGYLLGGKYLIKIDSLGYTQWKKNIRVSSIIKTSDGSYVLVGSQPAQLVKVDLQGNIEWSNSFDNYYTTTSGALARDGGYILAGTASGSAPMSMDYSGYVVKADHNGKIEWNLEYSGSNLINSIVATDDGCYVFTGVNPYFLSGGNDGLWLVKIGASPPPSPSPSPTPSPTIFPSPSPSPEPTSTPTSTPYQVPQQTEQLEIITGVVIAVAVFGAGLGLLIYLIKRK